MNLTDEEIVSSVQKGEGELFGVLIERYEVKMTRYARKFLSNYDDISDLVQEVFIKAYTNIQSFHTGKRFSPWIYRIAHNEFVNALRRKKKEPLPFFDADTLFPHPISPESADSRLDENQLKEALNQCLDKIDLKYKEPLILYYFEDMGYQEIAEVLQIPVSTVGVRIQRGKKLLKEICFKLK